LNLKSLIASLKGLLIGLVYGILVSALPVVLVKHRKPLEFFTDQSSEQWGFYVVALIVSAAAFAKTISQSQVFLTSPNEASSEENSEAIVLNKSQVHPIFAFIKKYGTKYRFGIIATIFLFWYTACAALCEKLRIFILPDVSIHLVPKIGLIFVALGGAILLRTVFDKDTVPDTKLHPWAVAHPIYAATLIYIFGIPLVFQTWFPLIAIPGAIVLLKWQLDSKSGTGSGTSHKWQIIPFLY